MDKSVINVTPEWVLAGEAIFTMSNGRGTHLTFKVYDTDPTPQYPNRAWFAKVLTGADNSNDYTYLGRVLVPGQGGNENGLDPKVSLTGRSKFSEGATSLKAIRFALRAVWQISRGEYALPDGYTIKHVGRCGRCGRPLTTPESLDTGYGPDCAAELGIEWSEKVEGGGGAARSAETPGGNNNRPRFVTFDLDTSGGH